MKKAYIQPDVQILSLAALEDFLVGSTSESVGDDIVDNENTDHDDWETDNDNDWG